MAKPLTENIIKIVVDLVDEPKGIIRMEINQDYISELAASISENGLFQPILLRPDKSRYEIVFGHRRYLAHKQLNLQGIKAIVRNMTDKEAAIARATENLSREDLTPIEEAATYRDLIDVYGMSIDQVARKIGMTPGTVRRRLDLLKMPPSLQKAVHGKLISMTVAEELWGIDDAASLEYYLSFAIDGGCTKGTAREWCKDWKDSVRRQRSSGEDGGGEISPLEPRPHYIACDICLEPAKIEDARSLMICPTCRELLSKKHKEG